MEHQGHTAAVQAALGVQLRLRDSLGAVGGSRDNIRVPYTALAQDK